MSTEEHQVWVDVIGHTVVGGNGISNDGWHHKGGGALAYALPTAFYQGTKSEHGTNIAIRNTSERKKYQKKELKKIEKWTPTDNTVPMLGHSICLQYRPHCLRLDGEMQRSHSAK